MVNVDTGVWLIYARRTIVYLWEYHKLGEQFCCAFQSIPQVFKLDPGSVRDLFLALRSCGRQGEESANSSETPLSTGNLEGEAVEPEVRRMWAMLEVIS